MTKDRPWLCSLLGEPQREAIAKKVALAVDLEFESDLLA